MKSKLEMGLARLSHLPAHDVVAHALTLAEHEVNEPTVESLNTAIALLLAVAETHGAGAAALRSCDASRGLAAGAARRPVQSRRRLLAAVLRTPGALPETPTPPPRQPKFSPVEVMRQESDVEEEEEEPDVGEVARSSETGRAGGPGRRLPVGPTKGAF